MTLHTVKCKECMMLFEQDREGRAVCPECRRPRFGKRGRDYYGKEPVLSRRLGNGFKWMKGEE